VTPLGVIATEAMGQGCEMSEEYLLQNGVAGNSPLWWKWGNCGYSDRVEDAKIWGESEADAQIRSSRGSHNFVKWPLSLVRKHAYLTVDIQDLRKDS